MWRLTHEEAARVHGAIAWGVLGVSIPSQASEQPKDTQSAGRHQKPWWEPPSPPGASQGDHHPRIRVACGEGAVCQARGSHWSSDWLDPLWTWDRDGKLGTPEQERRVTPPAPAPQPVPLPGHGHASGQACADAPSGNWDSSVTASH